MIKKNQEGLSIDESSAKARVNLQINSIDVKDGLKKFKDEFYHFPNPSSRAKIIN